MKIRNANFDVLFFWVLKLQSNKNQMMVHRLLIVTSY